MDRPFQQRMLAILFGVGVVVLVATTTTGPSPTGSVFAGAAAEATDVSVEVRHQVVEVSLVADLSCDGAAGAGSATMRLETWADFDGGRFRQRATYEDGSTRELLVLGDRNSPTQSYSSGEPLPSPACGNDTLFGDPTRFSHIVFLNPSFVSSYTPRYEELGEIVPGEHVDSLGRPAVLYREAGEGSSRSVDAVYVIRQVTDWYVDPATGDVLETMFMQKGVYQYDIRRTILLVSDDSIIVDAAIFDTDGFQLAWDSSDDLKPRSPATTFSVSVEE